MIRDVVRTVCIIAVMAVAASLIVETRLRLVAIEMAARPQAPAYVYAPQPPEEPGRLARLGRATLGLADAALEVVR